HADHELEIIIRKVTAANDHVHVAEPFGDVGAVNQAQLDVAYRQNFHHKKVWHGESAPPLSGSTERSTVRAPVFAPPDHKGDGVAARMAQADRPVGQSHCIGDGFGFAVQDHV